MLSYVDCVGFAGLTEDEIEAIAEHEHLPEIVAAEFGCCLCETTEGVPLMRRILLDDIRHAEAHGAVLHALHLRAVLAKFEAGHEVLH